MPTADSAQDQKATSDDVPSPPVSVPEKRLPDWPLEGAGAGAELGDGAGLDDGGGGGAADEGEGEGAADEGEGAGAADEGGGAGREEDVGSAWEVVSTELGSGATLAGAEGAEADVEADAKVVLRGLHRFRSCFFGTAALASRACTAWAGGGARPLARTECW